jgi:hypothetical protein
MQVLLRSDRSLGAFGALTFLVAVGGLFGAAGCTKLGSLPRASAPTSKPRTSETAPRVPTTAEIAISDSIERSEICVGSSVASAGELGDTLYYRAQLTPDGKLAVGYFAFFSEERPWGNNWLTWSVVPAIAVDLVYTRTLFVGPGLQRAIHGKGDVEGFRIVYDMQPDGTLNVERAVADDASHEYVYLDANEVLAMDPTRPTFYSNVWSHQLGARGVHAMSDLDYVRCFDKGHVRPLTDAIAKDFALAGRAPPAHVEALGGRALGG